MGRRGYGLNGASVRVGVSARARASHTSGIFVISGVILFIVGGILYLWSLNVFLFGMFIFGAIICWFLAYITNKEWLGSSKRR